jgi:hypothetical protein
MEDPKPRLTRTELGAHLRGHGYPISNSVLNKLCMQSVNQGPPVSCWWGRRPLYDPAEGIAWAEARTRPVRPGSSNASAGRHGAYEADTQV